jgi:hypothetical protein
MLSEPENSPGANKENLDDIHFKQRLNFGFFEWALLTKN